LILHVRTASSQGHVILNSDLILHQMRTCLQKFTLKGKYYDKPLQFLNSSDSWYSFKNDVNSAQHQTWTAHGMLKDGIQGCQWHC